MGIKKKYVVVGTGARSAFYYTAIARDYKETAEIVGFCDTNQTRMDYANSLLQSLGVIAVPTFKAGEFDRLIKETNPDEVIVTTVDRTHDIYIKRALELGCNVVTEKPMTIDALRCKQILDTVDKTGKRVRVTFNYRYAPHNTKIWELIQSGVIG